MTPEAQRIAIAEACGWKNVKATGFVANLSTVGIAGTKDGLRTSIPDYISDLNAMHEAEKALSDEDMEKATYFLWEIVLKEGDDDPVNLNGFSPETWITINLAAKVQRATATQRAEAFLRTLGKWVEE
jgi:hypothetical protein